jgi:Polyketide cyclase / dehydrase and lipid transport
LKDALFVYSGAKIIAMSILYILFIIFGGIALVVAIYGFTQPRLVKLTVAREIQTDTIAVFDQIQNFEQFVRWSPWSKKDPDMTQRFEGDPGEVGSAYFWSGNKKVGRGSMRITAKKSPEFVKMDLNFGPRGGAEVTFNVIPNGENTLVEWVFENDLGANPLSKAFGPLMKNMLQKDFEQGLKNLEEICKK